MSESKGLTLDQQANQIGQAYGKNGTNFEYLQKFKLIYQKLNINDSFSNHFENLYQKIILFRIGLSIHSQKWFQIYDQLQLLEDNQQNSNHSSTFISFQLNNLSNQIEQSTQIY